MKSLRILAPFAMSAVLAGCAINPPPDLYAYPPQARVEQMRPDQGCRYVNRHNVCVAAPAEQQVQPRPYLQRYYDDRCSAAAIASGTVVLAVCMDPYYYGSRTWYWRLPRHRHHR